MKWAVVSCDRHGNYQTQGFATKAEAEKYLREQAHPEFERNLYRLVPA